ncbi:MAG: hypothetical protein SGBAC_010467 [Bacillariaceae sp.]
METTSLEAPAFHSPQQDEGMLDMQDEAPSFDAYEDESDHDEYEDEESLPQHELNAILEEEKEERIRQDDTAEEKGGEMAYISDLPKPPVMNRAVSDAVVSEPSTNINNPNRRQRMSMKEFRLSLALDAAQLGKLTRLNEHTVTAVATESTNETEKDWSGIKAAHKLGTKSAFIRVVIEAAAMGRLHRGSEKSYTVTNYDEREEELNKNISEDANEAAKGMIEKILDTMQDTEYQLDEMLNELEVLQEVDPFSIEEFLPVLDALKSQVDALNHHLRFQPNSASTRLEQTIEQNREDISKSWAHHLTVIEDMENYQNAEDTFNGQNLAVIPCFDEPTFKKPTTFFMTKGKQRKLVPVQAAKEGRLKMELLSSGSDIRVRSTCHCPYCKKPSSFQTQSYKHMRERKQANDTTLKKELVGLARNRPSKKIVFAKSASANPLKPTPNFSKGMQHGMSWKSPRTQRRNFKEAEERRRMIEEQKALMLPGIDESTSTTGEPTDENNLHEPSFEGGKLTPTQQPKEAVSPSSENSSEPAKPRSSFGAGLISMISPRSSKRRSQKVGATKEAEKKKSEKSTAGRLMDWLSPSSHKRKVESSANTTSDSKPFTIPGLPSLYDDDESSTSSFANIGEEPDEPPEKTTAESNTNDSKSAAIPSLPSLDDAEESASEQPEEALDKYYAEIMEGFNDDVSPEVLHPADVSSKTSDNKTLVIPALPSLDDEEKCTAKELPQAAPKGMQPSTHVIEATHSDEGTIPDTEETIKESIQVDRASEHRADLTTNMAIPPDSVAPESPASQSTNAVDLDVASPAEEKNGPNSPPRTILQQNMSDNKSQQSQPTAMSPHGKSHDDLLSSSQYKSDVEDANNRSISLSEVDNIDFLSTTSLSRAASALDQRTDEETELLDQCDYLMPLKDPNSSHLSGFESSTSFTEYVDLDDGAFAKSKKTVSRNNSLQSDSSASKSSRRSHKLKRNSSSSSFSSKSRKKDKLSSSNSMRSDGSVKSSRSKKKSDRKSNKQSRSQRSERSIESEGSTKSAPPPLNSVKSDGSTKSSKSKKKSDRKAESSIPIPPPPSLKSSRSGGSVKSAKSRKSRSPKPGDSAKSSKSKKQLSRHLSMSREGATKPKRRELKRSNSIGSVKSSKTSRGSRRVNPDLADSAKSSKSKKKLTRHLSLMKEGSGKPARRSTKEALLDKSSDVDDSPKSSKSKRESAKTESKPKEKPQNWWQLDFVNLDEDDSGKRRSTEVKRCRSMGAASAKSSRRSRREDLKGEGQGKGKLSRHLSMPRAGAMKPNRRSNDASQSGSSGLESPTSTKSKRNSRHSNIKSDGPAKSSKSKNKLSRHSSMPRAGSSKPESRSIKKTASLHARTLQEGDQKEEQDDAPKRSSGISQRERSVSPSTRRSYLAPFSSPRAGRTVIPQKKKPSSAGRKSTNDSENSSHSTRKTVSKFSAPPRGEMRRTEESKTTNPDLQEYRTLVKMAVADTSSDVSSLRSSQSSLLSNDYEGDGAVRQPRPRTPSPAATPSSPLPSPHQSNPPVSSDLTQHSF